jgi:Cu+-exporting ATPase
MIRSLVATVALFAAAPAFACPMADAAAFADAAAKVEAATGAKATFAVEGLHCGDCSTKVTKALKGVSGVTEAAVDYQTGKTVVAFDSAKVKKADLLKAIADAGYKAKDAEG